MRNKTLNNMQDKTTENTLENNEKNKISKNSYIILIIGPLILLMLYTAIKYFIKYFDSTKVPIELNDIGITDLINHNSTINITLDIWFIIICIPFFVLMFLRLKKYKKNNISSKQILPITILILIMLIPSLVLTPIALKTNTKIDNSDWSISIETVTKKQRGGRKGRKCYVYLEGIAERKEVIPDEFKVYILEKDKVYVIYDKKNNKTTILSPKHYKYIGNKLANPSVYIANKTIKRGHFLFLGIILTSVSMFFIFVYIIRFYFYKNKNTNGKSSIE